MKQSFITILLTLTLVFCCTPQLISQSNVYIQYGKASFYADRFEGRITASGEKYISSEYTAAHLTLPFGTKVKVTNVNNDKTVIVRINDRGPFIQGRIIDLSKSAALEIGIMGQGVANIKLEVLNREESIQMPERETEKIATHEDESPISERKYYSMVAEKSSPKGFGVQIGSFKEMVNLMQVSEQLKSKYNQKITIEVSSVNDVKIYRIILGELQDRSRAEKLLEKIQKDYTSCFIYTFN